MNKYFLLGISILLVGCGGVGEEGSVVMEDDGGMSAVINVEEPVEDEGEKVSMTLGEMEFGDEDRQIVNLEDKSFASCFFYELRQGGEKVALSSEIEEAFDCPGTVPALSRDVQRRYLFYLSGVDLNIYDFETKKSTKLMSSFDDVEGIDCIWSIEGTTLACVFVNQQTYEYLTKIFVLDIENGELAKKTSYDRPVSFVCGGTCQPMEFWFGDDGKLNFIIHPMLRDQYDGPNYIQL